MKNNILKPAFALILLMSLNLTSGFCQQYSLLQDFEAGGSGSDGCWTGYSESATPSTGNFFTVTSPAQSGSHAAGMYSCCGGPITNKPTFYTSPKLIEGAHTVQVYLRQSSSFDEDFEIGTTTDSTGGGFIAQFTKSTWPSPVAWQLVNIQITTTSSNNRIAFRLPPASLKTYYLDSLFIGNTGSANSNCDYIFTTSVNDQHVLNEPKTVAYPNPVKECLIFNSTDNSNKHIKLVDIQGREVLQSIFSTEVIFNTELLSSGIYFYEIKGQSGSFQRGKLIKN
jgi:hypothetical protein